MKPIHEAKVLMVEITNHCDKKCRNCSRFCGHHPKPYFMSLNRFLLALNSLDEFKGMVGIMGGEPTLHPQFEEFCYYLTIYVPKERRGLWTNGLHWDKYEEIIRETFSLKNIVYNAHDYEYTGTHQSLLIASKDIIKDEVLRKELIDKCWVQSRWSAGINPNGAYFCEIAAAMGMLFDIKGWDIKKGWWDKEPKDFQDQVEIFCEMCSACIPFGKEVHESEEEYISISNLDHYIRHSDKCTILPSGVWTGYPFEIYLEEYTREDYERNLPSWKPGQFRDFYQVEKGKRLTKEEYEKL